MTSSSEELKFKSPNGVVKTVSVRKMVLKERDCTQTGTTYHLLEMGALGSDPYNANMVGQLSKEVFDQYRASYPDVPVIRVGTD